jgi:penicillin-binding protein 1A
VKPTPEITQNQNQLPPAPPTPKPKRRLISPEQSYRFKRLLIGIEQRINKVSASGNNGSLNKSYKFWFFLTLVAGLGGAIAAVGSFWYRLEASLPKNPEAALTFQRQGTLTIEAADGTVLQEIGEVSHEKLKIWQFPKDIKNAFLANEDSRFYEHDGVDYKGILRAVWVNLRAGRVQEGGSTITQQLAKITFLSQERSLMRKIKEYRIAQKIEDKLTKDQILEKYLNLVYLGEGAYGVADAAWIYFGKTIDQLTVSDAAILAAVVPSPSSYSPVKKSGEDQSIYQARLDRLKVQRDLVIGRMKNVGYITSQQAQEAIDTTLKFDVKQPKRLERKANYFTDYIYQELTKVVPAKTIQQGGLTIETTIYPNWQERAEEDVEKWVTRYGRWQGFSEAALVTIDPRSGQIRAMVGGKKFDKNQFNRVTQAKRQPGSTFKAFVYATAIACGFSPYRSYLNAEMTVDGYKPENFGDSYSGSQVSLAEAIRKSLNVVAVQTLIDVGFNPVINLANKMGIQSKLLPVYSLALGASEVTPLEITSAYGTFANRGIYHKAHGITRILDRTGKVIYQVDNKAGVQALDPESNSIVVWMMQSVVTGGTGGPAQIGRPVAGKTGTTDKARDLWFIGYIPQAVTGVWLGNDNNRPTNGASSTAASLWGRYMGKVTDDIPVESFPPPAQFDGRKATIKREKITPNLKFNLAPKKKDEKTRGNNNENNSGGRRRRRSRTQAYMTLLESQFTFRRTIDG